MYPIEPFRIKMIEPLSLTTREERTRLLDRAGHNLFRLRSEDVMVDLLTDSGTGAMSQGQWAAMLNGDESYAGARSYYRLEEVVRDITGYSHVLPTHQGRAAEALLFSVLDVKGRIVVNNTHFDTTRANVTFLGGEAVDLPCRESRDVATPFPFKGNMDLERLEALLDREGDRVTCVMMTVTNNASGGQPVSLENMQAVREMTRRRGLQMFLDACRFAENACLVKRRSPELQSQSIADISRAFFALADGCTMSAKKNGLANIGGFIALNDLGLAEQLRSRMVVTEGFPTYGGLAGRDLDAVAVGLREALDERYMAYRVDVVNWLAESLTEAGIPVVLPPGGHAVFVDAARLLPHIPTSRFPGQALACALYLEAGVRGVEIGSLMFGDAAQHELVRLAIPHRLYTRGHLEWVVQGLKKVAEQREELQGYRVVHEPPLLRHFTVVLEPFAMESARA